MNHPKGMYVVSLTEMWERFSFYIFVSILVLFMKEVLQFSSEFSAVLYGLIIGATYLFQLVAGYLTDTYMNNRISVIIGGTLMFISQLIFTYSASLYHLTTSVPVHDSFMFTTPEVIFLVGVVFMILGSGFFKVSVTSFIRLFYEEGDERLDSAYTIFYMFINIGGFLAPLLAGIVVGVNNPSLYQNGFLLGAFVVLVGTIMFILLRRYLVLPNGEPVGNIPLSKSKKFSKRNEDRESLKDEKLSKVEISHLSVIFMVLIVVILFNLSLEQISTSMVIFDMNYVDAVIPFTNIEVSPEVFISLPALLVIFIGPILIRFTSMLSDRNMEPSSISKFGYGLIITSLAFVMLLMSVYVSGGAVKIHMVWILLFSIFLVVGELLVMPIALSFISKLAPKKYTTLMMGVMFTATAISEIFAGLFASAFPETINEQTMLLNFIPINGLASFMWVFIILLAGSGIVWLLLRNKIKKLAHGVV